MRTLETQPIFTSAISDLFSIAEWNNRDSGEYLLSVHGFVERWLRHARKLQIAMLLRALAGLMQPGSKIRRRVKSVSGCMAILPKSINCWKRSVSDDGLLATASSTARLVTWEIIECGIFNIERRHRQRNAFSLALSTCFRHSHSNETKQFRKDASSVDFRFPLICDVGVLPNRTE